MAGLRHNNCQRGRAIRVFCLQGFEMVRAIILEEELFAVENNLLTPTFKLKRPKLKVRNSNCADTCHLPMRAPLEWQCIFCLTCVSCAGEVLAGI